jgi:hypothetical protein
MYISCMLCVRKFFLFLAENFHVDSGKEDFSKVRKVMSLVL